MGLWNANYNNIIKLFNHTLIIAPKFGVVYRKRFRLSDILMKLQNGAFRIITRESYEIRSADILENAGVSHLQARREHQLTLLMFKVKKNVANSFN